MAYILSLSASSPLQEPSRDANTNSYNGIGRSYSSAGSGRSFGTVQHHRLSSLSSGSSLSSSSSLAAPAFRRLDDHSGASRSSSSHNLMLHRKCTGSERRSVSESVFSRRTSFASVLSARRRSYAFATGDNEENRLLGVVEHDVETPKDYTGDDLSFVEEERSLNVIQDTNFAAPASDAFEQQPGPAHASTIPSSPQNSGPHRWLSILRRRKQHSPTLAKPAARRAALDDFDIRPSPPRSSHHRKTESMSSSLRLITAVRSATATLASISIATGSRRNAKGERGQQRSSVVSASEFRPSIDSQRSVMDEAARQRSRRRREKLEELIRSEESYFADLKALSRVSTTSIARQFQGLTRETGVLHHLGLSAHRRQLRSLDSAKEHIRPAESP